MSPKNLCVGLALAAAALVLTPTTSSANHGRFDNRSHVQNNHNSRSNNAYKEKIKKLVQKAKKHNGGQHGRVGVPELDPSGVGAAATLLLGGLLVAQGRRRRLALA